MPWPRCPLRITYSLLPPPKWPLLPLSQAILLPASPCFSSPWPSEALLSSRGTGTELTLNTVVLTPWKENAETCRHRPASTLGLGPILRDVGHLAALSWLLLAMLCCCQHGSCGNSVRISLCHSSAASHTSVHCACPPGSASMI